MIRWTHRWTLSLLELLSEPKKLTNIVQLKIKAQCIIECLYIYNMQGIIRQISWERVRDGRARGGGLRHWGGIRGTGSRRGDSQVDAVHLLRQEMQGAVNTVHYGKLIVTRQTFILASLTKLCSTKSPWVSWILKRPLENMRIVSAMVHIVQCCT